MAAVKLKFVYPDKDRQGRIRWRFRKPGCKAMTLRGAYGSPEFMANYQAAISEAEPTPKKGLGIAKTGTIAALVPIFYEHAVFTAKKPATQRSLRSYIDRLAAKHGDKPVGGPKGLLQEHVQAMVNAKATTPSAARNFLISLRALMKVAVAIGWRKKSDDPTVGVELPKIRGKGYRPWSDEHAAIYEAKYHMGTRERLAYECFSCTALRLSDVARLGRQYVRPLDQPVKVGPYTVTHELSLPYQEKTGEPLELWILPPLQAAIDALPAANMMFFVTPQGKPLSAKRLGSFFRESCLKVGLTPEVCDGSGEPKGLSAHGLRKRMGTRLAELETEHGFPAVSDEQIAAVFGHTDTRQVRIYTQAANKRRQRRAALRALLRAEQPRTSDLPTPDKGSPTG
jgi:integrase